MPDRRTVLGMVGAAATAALGGCQTRGRASAETTDGSADGGAVGDTDQRARQATAQSTGEVVTFLRNVEEVRGHLASAVTLLEQARREDAVLHAGHGSDYFAPVLTPLRDADPALATRLRARLSAVESRAESASADAFAAYVDGEVLPLLEEAVAAVVPADTREDPAVRVRVLNALAGRIAEEYTAAVPAPGTIELAGEYWDARGFLTRIEARHEAVADAVDGAGGDALGRLRENMENVAGAGAVREETLALRVATAAALPLPAARVEGRSAAVTYARNLEEVRGHLASAAELAAVGDSAASGLHAGHGADYVTTLLPAVRRADPDLADRLLEALLGVEARVGDGLAGYLDGEVRPLLDRAESVAVPDAFADDAAFDAAVLLALAGRLAEEYSAAVTEEEVIELYGEYWDARGFLTRIEALYGGVESTLDADTREAVAAELEVLREELETAATPEDVAGSVAALEDLLGDLAEGN